MKITFRESQKKFDYFFLGVIIGLLAISIQTYKPESYANFSYLIIVSWGLLLISFLSGMYKQEQFNKYLLIEISEFSTSEQLYDINRVLEEEALGVLDKEDDPFRNLGWSEREYWEFSDEAKDKLEKTRIILSKLKQRIDIAYSIKKWSFIAGLLMFAILRFLNY